MFDTLKRLSAATKLCYSLYSLNCGTWFLRAGTLRFQRPICSGVGYTIANHNLFNQCQNQPFRNTFLPGLRPRPSNTDSGSSQPIVLLAGILSFLGFKDKEEKASVMITTMKRAILLIQNGEPKKAEQMLHIALKLAQEEQNRDAITYIHDLLANLAFEQGEIEKAEKLFVSVMQRVLSAGTPLDDNKIIHMSLKLANIYNLKKDFHKAEDGYQFCSHGLQKKVEMGADDEDTILLWAMTLDWYARFLLERNRPDEAFHCFKRAYNLSIKINGAIHEQSVVLLNDLGTICCLKGDNAGALQYLGKAVEVAKHLPDMEDLGSVYVNLGNVYLKEGLYKESKISCEEGWKNGKRHNNKEVLAEANKCLDELKLAFNT